MTKLRTLWTKNFDTDQVYLYIIASEIDLYLKKEENEDTLEIMLSFDDIELLTKFKDDLIETVDDAIRELSGVEELEEKS